MAAHQAALDADDDYDDEDDDDDDEDGDEGSDDGDAATTAAAARRLMAQRELSTLINDNDAPLMAAERQAAAAVKEKLKGMEKDMDALNAAQAERRAAR
jgi:hypothetical protein